MTIFVEIRKNDFCRNRISPHNKHIFVTPKKCAYFGKYAYYGRGYYVGTVVYFLFIFSSLIDSNDDENDEEAPVSDSLILQLLHLLRISLESGQEANAIVALDELITKSRFLNQQDSFC